MKSKHPKADQVRHIIYKYEMALGELRPLEGEEAEYMKDFFQEHPRRGDYPSARPRDVFIYRNVEYGNRWLKASWPGVSPTSFSFKEILGEKKATSGYGKKTDGPPPAGGERKRTQRRVSPIKDGCAFGPIAS